MTSDAKATAGDDQKTSGAERAAVPLRSLWPDGPKVFPLGLGTWGLGGQSYGTISEAEALDVVSHALASGINFIDTSDLYGDGLAERIVGRACRGRRHEAVIATKGGMLPHSGLRERQDFSIEYLDRALTGSLTRLGCDFVDLYLLHSPPLNTLQNNPELWSFLDALRATRALGIGLSAKSPADALAALDIYPFDVVEVNFNLTDQRGLEVGLFDRLVRTGRRAIARTPLCFGFLTGLITAETRFGEADHRANWPRDQLERWSRAPQLFRPIAEARGQTAAGLALSFAMTPEAVACTIPGMMCVAEIDENLTAVRSVPLSDRELAKVGEIYTMGAFFDDTARMRGRQH